MRIVREERLSDFEFWGGARYTINELSYEDLMVLEDYFEEYEDYIDATRLNDIFWFEEDYLASILGYESWKDYINNRDKGEED